MRKAIICFLEREDEILLLLTDYKSKIVWNGVSGFIDGNQTAADAAIREIKEEIGVEVNSQDLIRKGEYDIFTIFTLKKWTGIPEPKESSIKELKWFNKNKLPYSEMHQGDEEWLPKFIN